MEFTGKVPFSMRVVPSMAKHAMERSFMPTRMKPLYSMMHVISFWMPFSSVVNRVVPPSSRSCRHTISRLFVMSSTNWAPRWLYRMRLSPSSDHAPRTSEAVSDSTFVGVICT